MSSASQILVATLTEALQDEYKAWATYAKVIETFGSVRPFINIVEAQGRHARALEQRFYLYNKSWMNFGIFSLRPLRYLCR